MNQTEAYFQEWAKNATKVIYGTSWGDAMLDEDESVVILPISNLTVMKDTDIETLPDIKVNTWFDEKSMKSLRRTFDKPEEPMATVGPIVVNEPKRTVLDYNHPAVINYIVADRKCSTIWNKKQLLQGSLKTAADQKSVIEQIIACLNEWLVASELRFASINQVNEAGDFDFEQCFKKFYPEEGERNHCKDMSDTYKGVKTWGLSKMKARLAKLVKESKK